MSNFGKNIKKIRSVRGLTQMQLGEMLDLNRGVISSYEEGRAEPKIETILKTSEVFQVTTDMLLKNYLTVNQLSGFSLPELGNKPGRENRQEIMPITFLKSLPENTISIPSSKIEKNPIIKEADWILGTVSKPVPGKTYVLQHKNRYVLEKISAVKKDFLILESGKLPIRDISRIIEVLGIFSPIHNVTTLEEKLTGLEKRIARLEAHLEIKP